MASRFLPHMRHGQCIVQTRCPNSEEAQLPNTVFVFQPTSHPNRNTRDIKEIREL